MAESAPEPSPELLEALLDPDKVAESLPLEEREAYEASLRSVIEARDSANRIEGQIWIT